MAVFLQPSHVEYFTNVATIRYDLPEFSHYVRSIWVDFSREFVIQKIAIGSEETGEEIPARHDVNVDDGHGKLWPISSTRALYNDGKMYVLLTIFHVEDRNLERFPRVCVFGVR